jgi:hypothetical protein
MKVGYLSIYLCLHPFFFFVVWEFELSVSHLLASTTWVTPSAPFQDRVSGTIYTDWSVISVFLISAPQVARITGVSHWCLANFFLVVLEFELRALFLVGRYPITWAMSSALFALIFWMGSYDYAGASLDLKPSISTSLIAAMTSMCHCDQSLLVEMECQELFAQVGLKPLSSWTLPPE